MRAVVRFRLFSVPVIARLLGSLGLAAAQDGAPLVTTFDDSGHTLRAMHCSSPLWVSCFRRR